MGIRDLTIYGDRKAAARVLRRKQTTAEEKLWECLRNRKLSKMKFRRQFPLGPYFADFCCMERRLIVEIDGSQHKLLKDSDNNRTRYLEEQGFRVLRFWNQDVLKDIEKVCKRISVFSPLPSGEGRLPKATG